MLAWVQSFHFHIQAGISKQQPSGQKQIITNSPAILFIRHRFARSVTAGTAALAVYYLQSVAQYLLRDDRKHFLLLSVTLFSPPFLTALLQ